jgi:hypothetical protein
MTDVRDGFARLTAAAADGRLKLVCRTRGLRLLVAFGSVLLPDSDPHDVDLAFARERRGTALGPLDLLGLIGDLTDVAVIDELDLLDLDRADPVAKAAALLPGLPLFESVEGEFARTQMAAFGEFADTAWIRRIELDGLAG